MSNTDTIASLSTADHITPRQAHEAQAAGALLVDVRGDAGRERDGLIEGAVIVAKPDLVPALSLDSRQRIAERTTADQKIVLICTTEKGTTPYLAELRKAGVENVVDVDGGVTAWKEQGLPTIPLSA